MRKVARDFDRSTVVVSPHGTRTGVYLDARGDLSAFGVPRAEARADVEQGEVRALAAAWDRPVLEEPLDHGIAVPLLVGALDVPIIAVGLAEGADPAADARSLAAALAQTEHDVIASVNTGAGITSRAPLTALDGADALENELREVLSEDVGRVDAVARRLAGRGGSCCLGPLLVAAELFAGATADVLVHEWPFGVGYLVVRLGNRR